MNITVVTPYDSSNFGAYLQAYCLSSWLKNQGYNVTHIPTRPADYVESLYFSRVPVSKKEKLIPAVYRKLSSIPLSSGAAWMCLLFPMRPA